ncbi:MAG: lipocalin family protein [Prevotellaceae bacterium]|nr:lipocalin family protein [Prevotellaceae bacterium]MDY3855576.1 lipocalin family protein [Bacteroidaceae bacterium]
MKKTGWISLLMLLTIGMLAFASCSDDDDAPSEQEVKEHIVGTWQSTHISGYWYDDNDDNSIVKVDRELKSAEQHRIHILQDGSFYEFRYSTFTSSWYPEGDSQNYTISENKFIVTKKYGSLSSKYVYTIISISDNTLVLGGCLDEGSKYTYRLTYKRVS